MNGCNESQRAGSFGEAPLQVKLPLAELTNEWRAQGALPRGADDWAIDRVARFVPLVDSVRVEKIPHRFFFVAKSQTSRRLQGNLQVCGDILKIISNCFRKKSHGIFHALNFLSERVKRSECLGHEIPAANCFLF